MRARGYASSVLTNCGRKAKKKIDSFGLRMLAHDRRGHVRDDAERAPEGRDRAGAGSAREAGRQGIEHAGAG